MPIALNQYIFGNSLVNFAGGGSRTNVPHWLDQFFEVNGGSYVVNGGYGFMRQFADRSTPANEWGFPGVAGLWDSDTQAFSNVSFDSIVLTPANFIQNLAPNDPYPGDSRSPLDAALDVTAQVQSEQPGASIMVYEGWADLGIFSESFPASASDYADYLAYARGAYADWYDDFVAALNIAAPDANVTLAPVNSVLMELITSGPLSSLVQTDLFTDTAPHGTENTYFLAAVIMYSLLTGEELMDAGSLPPTIHPEIVAALPSVTGFVADALDIATEPAFEALTGSAGDDLLRAGAGLFEVEGLDGNDRLIDRDGGDRLLGGAGDDLYVIYGDAMGTTRIVEEIGAGSDTIKTRYDVVLPDHVEEVFLFDGTDVRATGNGLNNLLNGHNGDNTLVGGGGDDTLRGGNGHDTLMGDEGRDILRGGNGRDLLSGGTGNDTLRGEVGADTLDGGAGDDRLIGGIGNDYLTGGVGADVFGFVGHFGFDRIGDFEAGSDRIDLSGLDALNNGLALTIDQLLIAQVGARVRIQLDLDRNGSVDQLDLDGDGDLDRARIDLVDANVADIGASDFVF